MTRRSAIRSPTASEHAITLIAGAWRVKSAGRRLDASRQVGEEPLHRASRSPPRRWAWSAAAISARSSHDRALGLRMKVIAFDPFLSPERARDIGVEKSSWTTFEACADFITLHTPLTREDQKHHRRGGDRQDEAGVRLIQFAPVADWSTSRRGRCVEREACRRRRVRRVRRRAGYLERAVRTSQCDLHAASRRRHQPKAQENVALSGRRADVRLSLDRRDFQRG